jgi:hypothetical protein
MARLISDAPLASILRVKGAPAVLDLVKATLVAGSTQKHSDVHAAVCAISRTSSASPFCGCHWALGHLPVSSTR